MSRIEFANMTPRETQIYRYEQAERLKYLGSEIAEKIHEATLPGGKVQEIVMGPRAWESVKEWTIANRPMRPLADFANVTYMGYPVRIEQEMGDDIVVVSQGRVNLQMPYRPIRPTPLDVQTSTDRRQILGDLFP